MNGAWWNTAPFRIAAGFPYARVRVELSRRLRNRMAAFATAPFLLALQFGQSASGELRLVVRDSSGLPVACRATLVSEANDISQPLETDANGQSVAKLLPFGRYHISIDQPAFARYDALVDIDSVVPHEYRVTLTP